MSPNELSAMIDKAIIDLISEQVIAALQRYKKRIAVLFTGNDRCAFLQALPQLQALSQQNGPLSLLFSYSARPMVEQYQAEITALSPAHICQPGEQTVQDYLDQVNQSSLLLLPGLSLNTLAKSAVGICDSVPSEVIAYALVQGKRMVASHSHLLHSASRGVSPAYIANIEQHITRLQAYGVEFVGPSALASGIELPGRAITAASGMTNPFNHYHGSHQPVEQRKRLVSLRDVLLHDASSPLSLTPDTLLTPAARDEIKKRKIQLINSIGDEYVSR